ncbi:MULTISPECIES: hypothetical protein [unclassified Microcoleus]|uniref:hypothetical protein n=1 Tax=unclassified Microcoleus TaxID=2642155 RepID=UPI002FD22B19
MPATVTRTFPVNLNSSYTPNSIIELVHFRDMTFDTDERVGIYLESCFCNMNLKSFQPGSIPEFEGDESEREKMSLFTQSENKSQKLGLKILTRKNNTGDWRKRAEIILVNREREDYFDLLQPYLAKNAVRILEANDSIAVQLADYGNGLLKVTDFIGIEFGITITIEKKNNTNYLEARLSAIEFAVKDYLTSVLPGNLLGRDDISGGVQLIPQNRFALSGDIEQAIIDWVGTAPSNLNTLIEFGNAINNDANFAATVTSEITNLNSQLINFNNQLAALTTLVTPIDAPRIITLTGNLNFASNTWFDVGTFNNIGLSLVCTLYALTINIQYGDGINSYEHWQYAGGTLISSIRWKAGGIQLATAFKMEAHNGDDFICYARFNVSNINRTLQLSFDAPIATHSPTTLQATLRRIV